MASNEQAVLKAAFGRTPACLPLELLEAVLEGTLSGDSVTGAKRHLDSCSYCRSELALFEDFQSAKPTSKTETEQLAWMRRELDSRFDGFPSSTSPEVNWGSRLLSFLAEYLWSWRSFAGVAAVAATMLVVIQVQNRPSEMAAPTKSAEVFRSPDFSNLAPAGSVAAVPDKLSWNPVTNAALYRVRILTVDESEIWRGETATSRVNLTPELRANFSPGRHFLWQVTASDPTGKKLAQSNLQEFYLRPTQ
jgi:hypothetical protein